MSTTTATSNSTLTQADYLKLLVTQLTQQDPMNPQSDTAFASELAQFSSLQATEDLSSNLQTMQAANLIGATVTVQSSTDSTTTSGVVSAVQIVSGTPEILVGGDYYTLSQIQSITPTTTTTANTSSSGSSGN